MLCTVDSLACHCSPYSARAVLRIQSEALRSANTALGEQKARVPGSRGYPLPVEANSGASTPLQSLPPAGMPEVIAARRDERENVPRLQNGQQVREKGAWAWGGPRVDMSLIVRGFL